jgi:nicotinamidase-related amidase
MIDDDDYVRPDSTHYALLIIDVQRDTTLAGTAIEIPGTLQAVPYIERLVQVYRDVGLPIFHVVRLYSKNGSNVDLFRRKAVEDGNGKQLLISESDGAELLDELKPSTSIKLDTDLLFSGDLQQIGTWEWIMYKSRWGAFYKTALERHLHNLGINTVVVCGCNFPNCPRTTIYEASERDFKIVLAKNATSLVYKIGLQELRNIGVSLMNSDECVAWVVASNSKIDNNNRLTQKLKIN